MIVKRMICNKNIRIVIILLSIFLCSCNHSIDIMLQEYNGVFCPGLAAGKDGYVPRMYRLNSLIEKDEYEVQRGGSIDFEVKNIYKEYEWSLTQDDKGYPVNTGRYSLCIYTKNLQLTDGYYTLTVKVKSDKGDIYFDTTQLIVKYKVSQ